MYTQNFNDRKSKTHVVSFPNKDSIIQMEKLNARSETKKEEIKAKPVQKNANNTPFDSLLLFGILFGISDGDNINTNLFPIIAGVLLAL